MTSSYFFPYDNHTGNPYKHSQVCAPLRAVRGFLLSAEFMLLPALVACICSGSGDAHTMTGLIINAQLFGLVLLLCDDFAAAMMPFFAVMCQGSTLFSRWDIILPYIIPWGILPAVGLLFHLTVYHRPVKPGISSYGLVATCLAIFLGGIGTVSPLAPFENTANAFYFFGLSFGLLFFYFLFSAHYKTIKNYDVYEHFLWQTLFTGIICGVIVLLTLLNANQNDLDFKEFRNNISFRNSIANIMIVGLPAGFYFAGKKSLPLYGKLLSFCLGCLVYVGLCFTASRTAILFGGILFILCLIYYFRTERAKLAKFLNLLIFLVCFSAFVCIAPKLLNLFSYQELWETFKTSPWSVFDVSGYRARFELFFVSVENFLAHPLFGAGLLSKSTEGLFSLGLGCMYWYHSFFPQVWGSFGLFGSIAYTLHLGIRAKLMCFQPDRASVAISLSALGLFLFSMTDPGEFMPIPFGMMAVLTFVLLERHMEAHPDNLLLSKKPTFITKNRGKT